MKDRMSRCFLGSPPPMRGKVNVLTGLKQSIRITPAHAGKSECRPFLRGTWKDHPRPCGEKTGIFALFHSREGSPPPMRGKVSRRIAANARAGITPAHAGKSEREGNHPLWSGDHPRPCGEKRDAARRGLRSVGSPPPMRGKVCAAKLFLRFFRITPAHAGKSCTFCPPKVTHQDHPRPCGEKVPVRAPLPAGLGSPPPMRGKASVFCYYRA